MPERFKALTDGLGPRFADLERRVQAHVELAEQVRAILPGPEKNHVLSVSCRNDTLTVLADSAAWCPQIRYAQAQLLELVRSSGRAEVTKVKVRVGRRSG